MRLRPQSGKKSETRPYTGLMSQGIVLMRKKSATCPADRPRSLSTMVKTWFGRYHMPWAK